MITRLIGAAGLGLALALGGTASVTAAEPLKIGVLATLEGTYTVLGEDGVRVNLVAPGILEGGMARHVSEELREDYLEHCSLKRLGTAEEVAELTAWLALENTYVTAQSILLDGGL